MFYRKEAAVALAVGSLLISAGLASAESYTPKLSLDNSVVTLDDAGAPAAPEGLLMQGLDKAGAGATLKKAGINVFGFVEGGWLYNPNRSNTTAFFDNHGESNLGHKFTANPDNRVQLNQVDITIERLVDTKKWDIGGRIEWIYGTDGALIHSNGMTMYQGVDGLSPEYQFDPVQAYVDIAVPVGNGLKVRAGKFVSPLGMEYINPTNNAFYSHSYAFLTSPSTFTGVEGTYAFNDQLAVTGGVVRGWDQSLEDDNGAVSGLFSVAYTPNKKLSIYFNGVVGPEGYKNTGYYTSLANLVASYKLSDRTSVGFDGNFGWDADGDHLWFGTALYASHVISDQVTANLRAEWMEDEDNARLGFPNVSDFGHGSLNVYEVTVGLSLKPFPKHDILRNLIIRPEARLDYADRDSFGGAQVGAEGEHWQFTTGADVIFTF